MNNDELWKAVLGEVELSVSKANFITWFRDTHIRSEEDGKMIIGVPNGFAREWLENRYNNYILRALQRHLPHIKEIICFIEGQNTPHAPAPKTASPQPATYRPIDVQPNANTSNVVVLPSTFSSQTAFTPQTMARPTSLNPRYTFENFIVGENNELARAACYAVAHQLGSLYNPLFIYGGVGLGKTHLLQAIGNEIARQNPDIVLKYTTSEKFTNELIESIKNQTMNAFKEAYQKVDLLLIDDVQFLSGREKTQNEFFHIFNALYQLNKQIVLTSDRPPRAIPTLEDRLRSRFEGGMMADISRPNLETRVAILKLKMADRVLRLDEESLRFIAEHITSNIRELEGALNRVIAACEFHRVTPTLAYTRKILGPMVVESRRTMTLETIGNAVAEFYHVEAEELMKKTRKKEVVKPRQIAMYLIREELQTPFSTIGRHFGGRDHTTTMHACDKITKEQEKDMQLKEEVQAIREQLRQYKQGGSEQ
jgi:chromosomal replication initiator protein